MRKVILTRVFELTHNCQGDVSQSEDGDFGGEALLNYGHGSFGRHVLEESKRAGNEHDHFQRFEHVHVHLGRGGTVVGTDS